MINIRKIEKEYYQINDILDKLTFIYDIVEDSREQNLFEPFLRYLIGKFVGALNIRVDNNRIPTLSEIKTILIMTKNVKDPDIVKKRKTLQNIYYDYKMEKDHDN